MGYVLRRERCTCVDIRVSSTAHSFLEEYYHRTTEFQITCLFSITLVEEVRTTKQHKLAVFSFLAHNE